MVHSSWGEARQGGVAWPLTEWSIHCQKDHFAGTVRDAGTLAEGPAEFDFRVVPGGSGFLSVKGEVIGRDDDGRAVLRLDALTTQSVS